ncbi:MAG: hypothetical protein IJJ63_01020 [Bacilli bacterium]|nr:hypothetical protein [Bacilli bacterium]MBQ6404609.1 hypothetical protein [Bacilli bacterium]
MQNNSKKDIRNQHIVNYKNTIIEVIKNNTNSLVDDDIMSLIRKPPLDSMDLIQSKFLSMAKKNKIVLKSDELSKILNNYRHEIIGLSDNLKKIRVDELVKKVNSSKLKDNEILKINKKDFTEINKEIKKLIKGKVNDTIQKEILDKVELLFSKDINSDIKDKIKKEITKYLKKQYLSQLIENIDIKILVKDTTLINSTKEQSERYLFTLNNSRLLKD